MLSIRSNNAAMHSVGALSRTQRSLSQSLAKISSGMRTSELGVDSAGLGVAVNLESRSQSYTAAMRNINDGISVIQTAEQALASTTDVLQRMRELSVQSASETLADTERSFISDEFSALTEELRRLGQNTEFNGIKLADNTVPTIDVQVGIDADSDNQIALVMPNLRSVFFAVNSESVGTASDALDSIEALDGQLATVGGERARLGAGHNRLLSALNAAGSAQIALTSGSSQIMDVDYSTETANLSKLQIMQSAGVASLSESRSMSLVALELLR